MLPERPSLPNPCLRKLVVRFKAREETGIVVHEVSAGIPLMPHFDVHVRLNINHCKLGCHIKRELEFLAAVQPGTSLGEREIVWKENPLTS